MVAEAEGTGFNGVAMPELFIEIGGAPARRVIFSQSCLYQKLTLKQSSCFSTESDEFNGKEGPAKCKETREGPLIRGEVDC